MDIIFDIDGTLLDIKHRVHYLYKSPPDWEGFNNNFEKDAPIHVMVKLLKILAFYNENRIIFCSGRSEKNRKITEKQVCNLLSENNKKYLPQDINLYMRKSNDFRKDSVVKSDLYRDMLGDGFNPQLVFDDRSSVVKMWREKGLKCLQVAEGNF